MKTQADRRAPLSGSEQILRRRLVAKAAIALTLVGLVAWLMADHQKAIWLPLSEFRTIGNGLFSIELIAAMFGLGLILQLARSYR